MDHLPKSFTSLDSQLQLKIVNAGLYVWSLLQAELERQKELNTDDLIRLWKDAGKQEAYAEKDREVARLLKEKDAVFQDLAAEKSIAEKRLASLEMEVAGKVAAEIQRNSVALQDRFDAEKQMMVREAKLAGAEEYSKLKEENTMLKMGTNFKEAYDFSQARYSELQKNHEVLQEKLEDLTRVRSSFQLGKDGEAEIEELLKQCADFDYENVNAEADKADFRIVAKDKTVFILDSKKYKRSVPKKEIDKLIANTDKDTTVAGGILVSLESKICRRSHCEVEFTPANKPILFLCLDDMTTEAKLHALDISFKLLLKLVETQDQVQRSELLEKMKRASGMLTDIMKKVEGIKKSATEILDTAKVSVADIKQVKEYLMV
jgi:hypothetical protein